MRMKKRICTFMIAVSMLLGLLQPDYTAYAASGSTSVSVSSGSVNIGDTVTVSAKALGPGGEKAYATMTLSYDSSILQFVSCSITYGGGGSSVTAAGDSFTVTLKAIAAGTSSVSLSASDGVVFDTNEELDSMSGSSASVTVNNAASTGGTTGGTTGGSTGTTGGDTGSTAGGSTGSATVEPSEGETRLSADNSLRTLTISPGTLSPAFSGQRTTYSATVANDVTSIAVTATPVHEKAVVQSVTGNDNLVEGNNAVKIVVKAENGVTATYTINVTRQAAGVTSSETPEEEKPEVSENEAETVQVGDVSYLISDAFAPEEIPVDFAEAAVNYHGTEHKGVSYSKGTLAMLYLIPAADENAAGKFFIYDEASDTLYPFVKINHGDRYVIALLAPADVVIPEVYQQTTAVVNETDSITAYQKTSEEETVSDFYAFYGVNQDGTVNWYQYDVLEGTYQRLAAGLTEEEAGEDEDSTLLQEQYAELSEQYADARSSYTNKMCIMVFVMVILIIIIINMLIHRFGRKDDPDDFDGEDLEETDEEDEELDEAGEKDEELGEAGGEDEELDEAGEEDEELDEKIKTEPRKRGLFGKRKREEQEDFLEEDTEEDEERKDEDFEVVDFNDL